MEYYKKNLVCSMFHVPCSKSEGFTIIELIITVAILTFGIIGIYSAFLPFIELTHTLSDRLTASYLAQEGLEIVTNMRDNNFIRSVAWSTDLTTCSTGCQGDYKTGVITQTSINMLTPYNPNAFLAINSDGFYSYDAGAATKFKREIIITQEGTDTLKVNVQVFWNYNSKPFTFQAEGYLYNWY